MRSTAIRRLVGTGASCVVLLVGCSGEERVETYTGDMEALAAGNASAAGSMDLPSMTPEGLGLHVEYFEALRKGDWVAPEHCWFSTRVGVGGMLSSGGFDGPRSDDDREAGEGVLVGSLSEPPYSGPTTTFTDDPIEPEVPASPPPHEGDLPSPGMTNTVVLAAVFGHDQVAELTTSDPSAVEGRASDSGPVDGWSLLSVVLEVPVEARTTTVQLRRVADDGTETTEELEVRLGRSDLQLLTDRWSFDLEGVDDSCVPPDEETTNQPHDPESDLFGSPIGDAPELPPPGEQPADPTASTFEALASLRAVYDMSDVYAGSKAEFVENPDDWRVMLVKLAANDVVGPYLSRLDPVFRNSVFVSPTELHVLYRVGPTYQWEIGRVLLIDGRWRVAAGTVCRDLAAANYTCPMVTPDPPPGPLG